MLCRSRNLVARVVDGGVCGVEGGEGGRFGHGIYVESSGLGVSFCASALWPYYLSVMRIEVIWKAEMQVQEKRRDIVMC